MIQSPLPFSTPADPVAARIEVVSASAGSGKTHAVATTLMRALVEGSARPEHVIATTFTNRAAAELQERVRRHLLAAGRHDEAHRLAAARIGTVNSVCGRLVGEMAFELGCSPALRVLDEAAAARMFDRAIAQVVSEREHDLLTELKERVVSFDWRKMVRRIVELARVNDIAPASLAECSRRSIAELTLLLDPLDEDEDLDAALQAALSEFVAKTDLVFDSTKKTAVAVGLAEQILTRLKRTRHISWADWRRLAYLEPAKKSEQNAAAVVTIAQRHLGHPQLRADLETGVGLVFDIARRALDAYSAYKTEWGVIDFADQEVLCLELLDQPDVRGRLKGDIDLVVVDEFQDTSPIQLAIFLRLAEVARRSVWVGDQKQSIFAFRGTDPALMDAVISVIGADRHSSLDTSYRSRPELVDLTSTVFAAAFANHGVAEHLVRLRAHAAVEPRLGPALEWWSLEGSNLAEDVECLASVVADLLTDETVTVRDRISGEPRLAAPHDVAVLCRSNSRCRSVAAALGQRGIRVVLPRTGLLASAEGSLVMAALRRWADFGDRLAEAEIGRLLSSEPERWLAEFLTQPASPSAGHLGRLDAARLAHQNADPLEAFDHVLDALDIRERCLAWGDSSQRLANLDALRAHIGRLLEDAAADFPPTVTGLVGYLSDLADGGTDTQQPIATADAVTISTWHAAKGLEWPITILYDLDRGWSDTLLGVNVANDSPSVDLSAPLDGRWVRCWLNPYHPMMSKGVFFERLAEHPETARAKDAASHQDLRLLYVGWTRARDRLVLAARTGKHTSGLLGIPSVLDKDERSFFRAPAQDGTAVWAGHAFTALQRSAPPLPGEPLEPEPGAGPVVAGRRTHPPAVRLASSIEAPGRPGAPQRLGPRLKIQPPVDHEHLGNAVHGFFAADDPTWPRDERLALAERLLAAWDVAAALTPADCVLAADRLWAWVGDTWPGAGLRREFTVAQRLADGSELRGTADLLAFADGGLVIIDHKTFPGSEEETALRAGAFAGQLAAYSAAAAAATGLAVIGQYIHAPIAGVVVPVTLAT